MTKLHSDILFLLRAAGAYGIALPELLRDLRQVRHRNLAEPQLERAARDLADKSFASTFESPISGTRWRITGLGESALHEEGL